MNETRGRADNNGAVRAIRYELQEIAEREAYKLWRLAWRMQSHGCNPDSIRKAREEANELYNTMAHGYPERLLDPFKTWAYAFRY